MCDLSDFDCDVIVCSRQADLIISETDDFLDFLQKNSEWAARLAKATCHWETSINGQRYCKCLEA